MLSDKKYGLTVSILATRVMPVLLPQLVNPQLDLEVYMMVQTTTQEMLDHIDKHQRNKLKGDLAELPKQPECLKLRTERGLETMAIPNLVIRRPSVVQVRMRVINTERVKQDRFSICLQRHSISRLQSVGLDNSKDLCSKRCFFLAHSQCPARPVSNVCDVQSVILFVIPLPLCSVSSLSLRV